MICEDCKNQLLIECLWTSTGHDIEVMICENCDKIEHVEY